MYFEQMLFLKPQTQNHSTSLNYSPITCSNEEEDTDERWEDERGSCGGTFETSTCRKKQRESNTSRKINYEEQLLYILEEKSERIDEKKTLLLSLVPRFKKLNDDQKYWAKTTKAKNMAFQPQYAQCFIAMTSLPQTHDYNLQYQNISTVSNIPNKKTVNSPPVEDALYKQSSDILDIC
jgi:hypothetical protein